VIERFLLVEIAFLPWLRKSAFIKICQARNQRLIGGLERAGVHRLPMENVPCS